MSAFLDQTLKVAMIMTLKNQHKEKVYSHIPSFVSRFSHNKIPVRSSRSDDQS